MTLPKPIVTALLASLALVSIADAATRESQIVFDRPGKVWESEALPLGNGRLGAMIFGGLSTDRIQFNENTLWTGDANPSGGYNYGEDKRGIFGCYQNFGDLFVQFGADAGGALETGSKSDKSAGGFGDAMAASKSDRNLASVPGYRRELNLSTARCTTTFEKDGVKFTREAFSSFPDQVVVLRYTASKPGAHTGVVRLKDGRDNPTRAKGNVLSAPGKLSTGLEYESRVAVLNEGGSVAVSGDAIVFSKCNALTIVLGARTNYVPSFEKGWMAGSATALLNRDMAAASKPYAALREAAEKSHRSLMDRVSLDVGDSGAEVQSMTSAARRKAVQDGATDLDLEEDLFNFSRYLLISSSRGGLPATLQGIWNDSNKPAWACDYHNNINVQMCYWGPEAANLAEMHQPLIKYVVDQAEPSRIATRADRQFGPKVRGWTARTSQNIFGGHGWQWNIPASAWYCQHLWEHYAFGRNKEYLARTAYPAMKEICEFWEDHLKELEADGANFKTDDRNADRSTLKGIKAGTLVAPNGWSPEHGPHEDGIAHDQQIIWDLFTNTAQAAYILGDKEYASKLVGLRKRLAPPRVGKWGQLMEWMIDRDGPNDTHRHTSQLFAVYPGRQISVAKTPELAKAAIVSLKARSNDKGDKPFTVDSTIGDSRRSWTWAWRCGMWARLGEGERAGTMVQGLIAHNMLSNLFATHPPFQIDGNLGIGGGMCEMLLQSHADEIQFLPAIPARWANGSVKGLRARGGFTVDMKWTDGRVTEAQILSNAGETVRLRAGVEVSVTADGSPVATKSDGKGVVSFATRKGAAYRIAAK